jgi:uncharacterized protein (TIRG00374 family)
MTPERTRSRRAVGRPVRRWSRWISGLLILAAAVAVIVNRAEIEDVLRLSRNAQPLWLIFAAILQALTYVSAALVWYILLRSAGHRYPLHRLVPLGVAKLFADQSMPSVGISGTAFFVSALSRRGIPPNVCLATMVLSVAAYYGAYLIMAVLCLGVLWLHHAIRIWIVGLLGVFMLAAPTIPTIVLWLTSRAQAALPRWLERLPGAARWRPFLGKVASPLRARDRLRAASVATLPHLSVFLLDAATLWVALRAIGEPTGFLVALPAFVLGSIASTLGPIPLGLGTFEATCVAALVTLGVSAEGALAGTLLLRGCTLWLPMLPGLWLARRELAYDR